MLCDVLVDVRPLYCLEADANTGAEEHPLMAEKIHARQPVWLGRNGTTDRFFDQYSGALL